MELGDKEASNGSVHLVRSCSRESRAQNSVQNPVQSFVNGETVKNREGVDGMELNGGKLRQSPAIRKLTRPDSLKVELLETSESVRNSLVFTPVNQVKLGFRDLSYSVRDGIFPRSMYSNFFVYLF